MLRQRALLQFRADLIAHFDASAVQLEMKWISE